MTLNVIRIVDPAAVQDMAAEWAHVDSRVTPRSPFSSLAWNMLWWKHYCRHTWLCKDEFFVHAVRAPDGRLVAIAPLFIRECPSFGPLRWRFIQFFGADASMTELRGLVCAPDDQDAALSALAEYLKVDYRGWELLRWDGLRSRPAAAGTQRMGLRCAAIGQLPNYLIPLPATWGEMLARLNGKFKRNMRKRCEFLEQAGFTFKLRVADNPEAIRRFLATFFNLHRLRAATQSMNIKHPDRFADPVNRAFISDYVQVTTAHAGCRMFELDIDGKTVASMLAFAMDRDLWLYSSGFDPEWAKYGVMTLLTTEILKWAIDAKLKVVNLSCGQDMGKIRWNPIEVIYYDWLEGAPGTKGRLLMQAYEAVHALRRTAAWVHGYRPGKGRQIAS